MALLVEEGFDRTADHSLGLSHAAIEGGAEAGADFVRSVFEGHLTQIGNCIQAELTGHVAHVLVAKPPATHARVFDVGVDHEHVEDDELLGRPIEAATLNAGTAPFAVNDDVAAVGETGCQLLWGDVLEMCIRDSANYAGTSQWEIRKDASNTFRIRDTVNSVDRFIQYAGTQTEISSGGTSSVAINNTSSSGTGGFIVYEGGTNYNTIAFSVASNGNAAVTGTLTANATTITTTLTAATVKDTGVLSAYLIGTDSSGDLLAETMSGDATLGSGGALTLASVNSNTGSFGSSTAIPTFTVNAKGLITAAGSTAVIAPAGTLTGTALASTVVTSSLTTVGTIGTGVWQGTAIGVGYGGLNTATAPSAGQILIAQSATAYAPETCLLYTSSVMS